MAEEKTVEMTEEEYRQLITTIAGREGTAEEIAQWWGVSVAWLEQFVEENMQELITERIAIEAGDEEAEEEDENTPPDFVTPQQLSELWVSKQAARLERYQNIADKLYKESMKPGTDAVALRELRSYLSLAANELGQLMHRGAGNTGADDVLTVQWGGVDPDADFK